VATSNLISVLGVFEDRAQEEFISGLLNSMLPADGPQIKWTCRLTRGCRYNHLIRWLRGQTAFHGVVVGIDAGRHTAIEKRKTLQARVSQELPESGWIPTLWAIAHPSIEEWMMADVQAFPQALAVRFSSKPLRKANRPGKANSERTAKVRLDDWAQGLLGAPLLDRGQIYARETGTRTRASRVGKSRNADLHRLLHDELPPFLRACSSQRPAS
jgi:hypothetical protein